MSADLQEISNKLNFRNKHLNIFFEYWRRPGNPGRPQLEDGPEGTPFSMHHSIERELKFASTLTR